MAKREINHVWEYLFVCCLIAVWDPNLVNKIPPMGSHLPPTKPINFIGSCMSSSAVIISCHHSIYLRIHSGPLVSDSSSTSS